ncbi:phosphoenolpyruvate-protein phosphotransferase [Kribbella flavida DSM 17836]|uniref:Phosphocarrier protein HPr n=1 Tax=Kribbella flavida (strain DSM 17836 / JCM 10339 / NBRC 14399) TaxID=479435 RepID=D2PZU0_KRIFD|nr:phosphoenolpyruvate--protein phosphotransferase [Kribbella flavida]ADB35656.1 phosphoenolpyruvate-protein phosphotransferase [Kribbella flavida DSM 17836]
MIGIVVVSHSRTLAEAAVGLASEMVADGNRPQLAVAAGLDASTFGTDAAAVAEAIGTVDGPDGVLVLLDLGSAVLSAEMALEFVDPETAARVVLSSAPLVEGLVAAVVTASTGAPLATVVAEARQGLAGKQEHLGDAAPPEETAEPEDDADQLKLEVAVRIEHGLHARPAAKLVAVVQRFDAKVTVYDLDTGRGPVDAGSLSRVATLSAQQHHRLEFAAGGPQAADALRAIRELAERDFDDVTTSASPEPRAVAVAGGTGLDVAVGPAVVAGDEVDLADYEPGDHDVERERAERARRDAEQQLRRLRDTTAEQLGSPEAGIFDAQAGLLGDGAVLDRVFRSVAQGIDAATAWKQALDELAQTFDGLDDPYQRERAQDVRSVRDRVLRALTGAAETGRPVDGGILVVPELDAATAATVDGDRVAGIAVRAAGTTGHGVIVARSRGIPLITGIGDVAVADGTTVGFDARAGSFVADPDLQAFARIVRERTEERDAALRAVDEPATTLDGRTIPVLVNVGSVQDALDARGADGSGLVRTEVLFGDRRSAPTAAEQAAAYREIAAALGGKPITIRTWDVGGDKPLRFLPQAPEANPFLGDRGLRTFRRRPELLATQLAAIREVARETPVQVMFPMVTTAEEVAWALEQLDGLGPRPDGLQVGMMVEVPAAALRIETLAGGLDFVSIGTNDLTQYTTAADRTNPAVAALADGLDPAVLRLVDRVVRQAPEGVHVAVCGDLASDPLATEVLVGLGVHALSAVGPQIPLLKARLRQLDTTTAAATATKALTLPSAEAVRTLLTSPH